MHILFWYWIIDSQKIFPTIAEADTYCLIFLNASMVAACQVSITEFIQKEVDHQVSSTSSESLRKNTVF